MAMLNYLVLTNTNPVEVPLLIAAVEDAQIVLDRTIANFWDYNLPIVAYLRSIGGFALPCLIAIDNADDTKILFESDPANIAGFQAAADILYAEKYPV